MNQEQIDSMIAHYTKLRLAGRISDYTFDRVIDDIRAELKHQSSQPTNRRTYCPMCGQSVDANDDAEAYNQCLRYREAFVTPEDAAKLRALGLTVLA